MSPSLLEQAKGGDADAIATLMNQALQPRGVTVRGYRQGDRLQLWLSAPTIPPQAATVDYVLRGLERLQVTVLTILELYVDSANPQQSGWGVKVDLGTIPPQVIPIEPHPIEPHSIDQPTAAARPTVEPGPPEPEPLAPEILEPESLDPEDTPAPEAWTPPTRAGEPGTIDYAYALLGLEPGSPLNQVEGTYFKLKAQALREGNRAWVEDLKQAFYQLKNYIEQPSVGVGGGGAGPAVPPPPPPPPPPSSPLTRPGYLPAPCPAG
jgi:hypothetical protein